ncbi:hypothetical protein [Flavobacterium sp.]|uniref:hypothetical protein n=1 Tax=Flavobacterium sp. TaxID=239 RepID=UPI003527B0BA
MITWIALNYLKVLKLSEQDLNSNIVITNFKMFQNDSNIDASLPYCNLENEIFNYDSLLLDWDIKYTIPCIVLYSKNCIGNLRFEEKHTIKRRLGYVVINFCNGLKTIFLNEYLAYYRVNEYGNHTNDG